MKILEWNINCNKNATIPDFVGKEIISKEADIVVLTEFMKVSNWKDFVNHLYASNYNVFNNSETIKKQKEVLIAVKKGIPSKLVDNTQRNYGKMPNLLHVEVEHEGMPLAIIGTRVRILGNYTAEDYIERKEQFDSLIKYLKDNTIENTVVVGDFNNSNILGKESDNYEKVKKLYDNKPLTKHYNYHMIKDEFKKIGYHVHTPEGNSWGGYIKNDHAVTSDGLEVDYPIDDYYWGFRKNNDTYKRPWKERVGYPDHAILIVNVKPKSSNL